VGKFAIALAVLAVAGLAFLLSSRDGKAEVTRTCIEDVGATVVKESGQFQLLFPYLVALGENARVRSFPELDDAKVYGVRFGAGEAVLFLAGSDDDARDIEGTLLDLAASEGSDLPSRRAGNVVLVWTVPVPLSESLAIDACVK
jgi:hypothetical protein